MTIVDTQSAPYRSIGPVRYQILSAEPVAVLRLVVPPYTELPAEAHETFQMGYVLSGSGVMTIGDETTTVGSGMAYSVSPNVFHDLRTGQDPLELLDVYYPPKEDRL